MIPKPIHEISLADLNSLVGTVREGKTIEFKSALPEGSDRGIVAFVGGVSALANTGGGDFVIGVAATEDGVASEITGVACPNIDSEKLRLENLLRSWLEPRLPRVDIQTVHIAEDRHALILRVHRSWIGPHRLTKDNKFYGRNSAGKYPLDVIELRSAFHYGETAAERIRAFRADRVAKIMAGETPVPTVSSAMMVLHMIPLPSIAERQLVDVVANLASGYIVPLPLEGPSGGNRSVFNLDGYLNCLYGGSERARSYVQLFRSGAIEGVNCLSSDDQGGSYITGEIFDQRINAAAQQYLRVLSALEVGFPIFAMVSLIGVRGCYMRYDAGGFWQSAPPLQENVISLPEVTIDRADASVPTLMRPSLNIVWNGFGFVQSRMYGPDGTWKGQ